MGGGRGGGGGGWWGERRRLLLRRVGRGGVHAVVLRARVRLGLVLLFPLHAPVLEPNLDLPFRQAERVRDFDASAPRQVTIEVELFFQFQRLVACVRLPAALPL